MDVTKVTNSGKPFRSRWRVRGFDLFRHLPSDKEGTVRPDREEGLALCLVGRLEPRVAALACRDARWTPPLGNVDLMKTKACPTLTKTVSSKVLVSFAPTLSLPPPPPKKKKLVKYVRDPAKKSFALAWGWVSFPCHVIHQGASGAVDDVRNDHRIEATDRTERVHRDCNMGIMRLKGK